ncbi:hypothetical protein ACFO4O_10650 [Glaciecola siphonariae]|uniref:DUF4296 domain-containing protein n=1 Tax=Glaciecola siphonariae TaxID=521012 RepID=A0ABV9LWH3_9ALTE
MRKGILLIAFVFITSCASTSQSDKIDVDAEFERLYAVLEIEDTIDSLFGLGVTYMDAENVVMISSEGAEINTTPTQRAIAKEAFKQAILSRLAPYELRNAADFYSTKQGLKAHKAIIDAEYAVSKVLNNE